MYRSVDLRSLNLYIDSINYGELTVPLKSSVNVNSVYYNQVHNLYVRIKLVSGTESFVGLGEIIFEFALSKECHLSAQKALDTFANKLVGTQIVSWDHLTRSMSESLAAYPNVMAGIEMAVWDGVCRKLQVPLYYFMGGHSRSISTDVTIPNCSVAESFRLARKYSNRGFELLKVVVGTDFDSDVKRVASIVDANPNGLIILDANESYTAESALLFLKEMKKVHAKVCLFEQPVNRDDTDGFMKVTRESEVLTAADESIQCVTDAVAAMDMGLADVINIKLSKFGIHQSTQLVDMAKERKMSLMIGSSLDTRISAGFSAHFAAGIGHFQWVDLDSPLLLAMDPVIGGVKLQGQYYNLDNSVSGIDVDIEQEHCYSIAA